jgi:hypothetical protein
MKLKRNIIILLMLFLIADISFSFVQYFNTPLYGELDGCVLPNKNVQKVFDHPLGFKALATGERYLNPNRYFSHMPLSVYFKNVPFWLQSFLSPIDSVYAASAIAKLLTQIVFLFALAWFISEDKKLFTQKVLIALVILAPLIQINGYYSRMSIIDRSVLYTFFYGIPLTLLMILLMYLYRVMENKYRMPFWVFLLILPFTLMLPLSSPLISPTILII